MTKTELEMHYKQLAKKGAGFLLTADKSLYQRQSHIIWNPKSYKKIKGKVAYYRGSKPKGSLDNRSLNAYIGGNCPEFSKIQSNTLINRGLSLEYPNWKNKFYFGDVLYRALTTQEIEDHQLKNANADNLLVAFGIRNKWLNLYPIASKSTAKEVIKLNHYSHTVPAATGCTYGIFHADNTSRKADGYIMLGSGIRPLKKNSWGEEINENNAIEIDRMWLSDKMPKNSESMALAAMIKYLKKFTSIKYLISYSDGSVGNSGTIYKAANFHYDGFIKADFYILADGTRVHPVSMWHRHGTRKREVLEKIYPGITKAQGVQHRFIYKIK